MAVTNVYGNGTTTATAGANTITHYYDRAGIKAANRVNVYGQWADRKQMPKKHGKTFKISKFLHIYDRAPADGDFAAKGFMTARTAAEVSAALTNAQLAEGAGAVNKRSIQKITVETNCARYGEMIDYTDEVEIFSEDKIQVRYREELGELANSRMEDLVQLDMLGTGTVIYSGAATSLETVDTKASYDLIRKSVRKLVRNRAKKNSEIVTGSAKIDTKTVAQAFYAIIGADVKSDLESLTRGSGAEAEFVFTPAHKYAAAGNLAEGEVGAMHEVRFIEAEGAIVYGGAGKAYRAASTGAVTTDATLATTTFADAAAVLAVRSTVAGVDGADVVTEYADAAALTASGDTLVDTYADVFPILFPTKGAFATVGLKGEGKIKFHSRDPQFVTNENPYGTQGFFSYNFWYAGIILEEEKLLKVLVAASA